MVTALQKREHEALSTIIIAEKAKAARAIADALGAVTEEKQGSIKVFHVQGRNIVVVPLRGHITNYQTVAKFGSWQHSDPREIVTDTDALNRVQLPNVQAYIRALEQYGRAANTCVIGTDADVEGCTIGIVDALPFILNINPSITVRQLWVNSLQKKEVEQAFAQLTAPRYSGRMRGTHDHLLMRSLGSRRLVR